MKRSVYNLEFRPGFGEMQVAGLRFSAVPDYQERFQQLQQLVEMHGTMRASINTGGHAHTAVVQFEEPMPSAALGWGIDSASALDDILLLLSLFTHRYVFHLEQDADLSSRAILAEARIFPWGGVLGNSIPYEGSPLRNDSTLPEDVLFSKGINDIYSRICSKEWLARFDNGHFLFLAFNAFQQRLPTSAFIHCWTIWEHLFFLLTRSWLTENTIRNLKATEKIAYILVKFAVCENLQEKEKKRLESLARIRNRLIHHGHLPESGSAVSDAMMFIRMTEFVIAKILGLQPSSIFNTIENFEEFLARKNS